MFHKTLIILFLLDSGGFFTNSSFSPLMATTIFRFDALYAEKTTVIKVYIKPLEKAISNEVIE